MSKKTAFVLESDDPIGTTLDALVEEIMKYQKWQEDSTVFNMMEIA